MTIDAIAQRAEVSAQSVYAIFRSKAGILTELLSQSIFGADYQDAVREVMSANLPESRLRIAARIARQIHQAQSATFDLLRGAKVVAPEIAKLEHWGERLRYKRQEEMIVLLQRSGRLRKTLNQRTARDIFWMSTGRDVYRMLVRERGWSPQQYEGWLGETLVETLLTPVERD